MATRIMTPLRVDSITPLSPPQEHRTTTTPPSQPTTTMLSNKRSSRQTLTTAGCLLLSTIKAQQHPQLPQIDLKNGILKRPLDIDPSNYVLYDFKPAFPPYTKESVKELLLFPDQGVSDNDDKKQQVDIEDNVVSDDGAGDVHSDKHVEVAVDETGTINATDETSAAEQLHLDSNDARDPDQVDPVNEDDISASEAIIGSDEGSEINSERQHAASTEITIGDESESTELQEDSSHETDDGNGDGIIDDNGQPTPIAGATDSIQNEMEEHTVHEYSTEDFKADDGETQHDSFTSDLEANVEIDTSGLEKNEDIDDHTNLITDEDTPIDSSDSVLYVDEEILTTNDETESPSEMHQDSLTVNESAEESTVNTQEDATQQETADRITINYDESPPAVPINKDQDANREFVTGLDEIDKFFESVSPPDELDVGADGSSMQDVLVGQGLKIIYKRAKSIGSNVKQRFEKIVEKALPQQLMNLAREDEEEDEASVEDILNMMKGEVPLILKSDSNAKNNNKYNDKESSKNDATSTSKEEVDKIENRFPLLKRPRVNKIYRYAKKKWRQAKHLLGDFLSIFGGDDEDDEEIDFGAEFSGMNFDDVKSLMEKSRAQIKKSAEMPQFGSDVDDSFVRSRHQAMKK
eukprot:scaffold27514_cov69-Cyclotella_meneghiniana.AAC.5